VAWEGDAGSQVFVIGYQRTEERESREDFEIKKDELGSDE
jgi:hypothetical protein